MPSPKAEDESAARTRLIEILSHFHGIRKLSIVHCYAKLPSFATPLYVYVKWSGAYYALHFNTPFECEKRWITFKGYKDTTANGIRFEMLSSANDIAFNIVSD